MNHIVFLHQQSLEKILIKYSKRKSQEDKLPLYQMSQLTFNNKEFHQQNLHRDFKFRRDLQVEEDSIKY